MAEEKKVLFKVTNLKQYFPLKKQLGKPQLYVKANDGLTFDIYEGETFGLVGESGCGKSTLGRVLLQLYQQTAGQSMYYGRTQAQIAPVYVRSLIQNAEKRIEHAKALKEKYDAAKKAYDALDENGKMEKYDAMAQSRREAKEAWLNIVQVLGGFAAVDDLSRAKTSLMKEWTLSRELRDLRIKENHWKIRESANHNSYEAAKKDGKEKPGFLKKAESKKAKAQQYSAKIAELEKQLAQAESETDALRKEFADVKGFAEYESQRDFGIDLAKLKYREMRILRKDIQLIFQDPYSSLNPRMTVGQIIGEGLKTHEEFVQSDPAYQDYILKVMDECGLAPYFLHRYPHQFSGGQRQRIGIARSLAMQPKFVVCDEAVSALDVSIQSQIINLLKDMKEKSNYTYLFITHDLSVVKYISDRIGVMYLGNMVELSSSQELFSNPKHPYTEALLSAIPTTDVDSKKETILLEGDIPSPINPPKGCKFHTRCRYCTEICKVQIPEWEEVGPGHFVACHHKLDN